MWGAGMDRGKVRQLVQLAGYLAQALARGVRKTRGLFVCATKTENSLGTPYHVGGYDPDEPASVPDDLDYGANFKDCEDYALHRQTTWENGIANSVDWANPGKQY